MPAGEIEGLVINAIRDWAADDRRVLDAVGWKDAKRADEALKAAKRFGLELSQTPSSVLTGCVRRVKVAPEKVSIELYLVSGGIDMCSGQGAEVTIDVPSKRRRYRMATRLVIEGRASLVAKREPDPALVSMVVKGRAWLQKFTLEGKTIEQIAEQEHFSTRYVNRVINVALLAPDILAKMEQGNQPEGVNATSLLTSVPFPEHWDEQRKVLGLPL